MRPVAGSLASASPGGYRVNEEASSANCIGLCIKVTTGGYVSNQTKGTWGNVLDPGARPKSRGRILLFRRYSQPKRPSRRLAPSNKVTIHSIP
jgi:hypothetical protein